MEEFNFDTELLTEKEAKMAKPIPRFTPMSKKVAKLQGKVDTEKGPSIAPGTEIISDSWPGLILKVGYGLIYSPRQNVYVIGCTDRCNEYYTAIPIFDVEGKLIVKIIVE